LSRLVGFLLLLSLSVLPVFTSAQADPPGRVARLSYSSGTVSILPAGSDQWVSADLNRPLTTGDRLWVPPDARAELHTGASAIRLDEKTSLTIVHLNDDKLQLSMAGGSMLLRLRSLANQESVEVNTSNLAFLPQEAGEYRLSANDDTSSVIIRRGSGVVYGERDSISLREAEQASFSGTNLAHTSINRMPPYDNFDQWVNERDRLEDRSVSARYVSRDVIGYQQLDDYGTWETTTQYGAVWIPRITDSSWAPYRSGNWLWVAPWGWTWVDRAPWGFAPYHYGRWAQIGPRWAWVPGAYQGRPVYAPALVAFVGGGEHGFNASLNVYSRGNHAPAVAWFPLAPGEIYRPGYHSSPTYLNRINNTTIYNINNSTVIKHNDDNHRYLHQRSNNAVSSLPADSFARGHSNNGLATRLGPREVAGLPASTGAPSIAPSGSSLLGNARRLDPPASERSIQRRLPRTDSRPDGLPNGQENRNDRFIARYGSRTFDHGNEAIPMPQDARSRPVPVMPAANPNNAGQNLSLPSVRNLDTPVTGTSLPARSRYPEPERRAGTVNYRSNVTIPVPAPVPSNNLAGQNPAPAAMPASPPVSPVMRSAPAGIDTGEAMRQRSLQERPEQARTVRIAPGIASRIEPRAEQRPEPRPETRPEVKEAMRQFPREQQREQQREFRHSGGNNAGHQERQASVQIPAPAPIPAPRAMPQMAAPSAAPRTEHTPAAEVRAERQRGSNQNRAHEQER
jgi:hypothetical protein